MDETKIENVEATEEVKLEVSESAEIVEEVKSEETSEVVAEGKDACEANDPKKEPEDDQNEKKVAVEQVKKNLEGKKSEAKEITEESEEKVEDKSEVMEALLDIAAQKVSDIITEALNNTPIEEGVSKEEKEAEIVEQGQKLLNDVMSVLEEIVQGTTMELKGAQVEVKDFVQTGGKVNAGPEAGINPPSKSEDDEHEKKVTIKEYPAHEAEEIDYKAKYAESEAVMDDLVKMVEETASQYTALVEEFNKVATELQAYKLAEEFSATVEECADMLQDYDYEDIREEFIKVISKQNEEISEEKEAEAHAEEPKAEEVAEAKEEDKKEAEAPAEEPKEEAPAEEKKEEKEEDKKEAEAPAEELKEEETEEKSDVNEIQESLENVKDVIIAEAEEEAPVRKNRAFSVFGNSISESKQTHKGKAFSVFAD